MSQSAPTIASTTSAPSRPIRVAVCNDVDIIVRGVARVLEPYADRVDVVELEVRQPVVEEVDVILYDTFAQAQGDRMCVGEVQVSTGARVVVFSWNTDPRLVRKVMDEGAAGYISKGVSAEDLVLAIEHAVAGSSAGPEVVVGPQDGSDDFGDWPGQKFGLRARESEILFHIARGLSNQQIVELAYIGMNTLKTHIRHLYRKIGVETRPQAVLWAYENGFQIDAPHEA